MDAARLILCTLGAHLDLCSVRDGIGPGMLLKAVQVAKEHQDQHIFNNCLHSPSLCCYQMDTHTQQTRRILTDQTHITHTSISKPTMWAYNINPNELFMLKLFKVQS